MMADDVRQVKVANWGNFFLQRIKDFFNRTDYCDLTLQFRDNAQLKVHRLVLSGCTEYFEVLERTCEMYEDCLIMPEDLQADIIVPIVNFMYTGQLEFKMELLERLHQCSEIMDLPVLSELLAAHRPKNNITHSYNTVKRPAYVKNPEVKETIKSISATEIITTSIPITYKRSHSKAFDKTTIYRDKNVYLPKSNTKAVLKSNGPVRTYREPSPIPLDQRYNKKVVLGDPRPTRYELPDELDTENIFENSFTNISYTSQPLMVHPETRKQYSKRPRLQAAGEASSSKKSGPTTLDIVDCRKPIKAHEEALFEDIVSDDAGMFPDQFLNIKTESSRDPNQLFDQILERSEDGPSVTIETKNKTSANLDHAKIISEVLKKYPHLVKSNKNIKLKILNTPTKTIKKQKLSPTLGFEKPIKTEKEPDFTYETDVLDSKQAARLIAMGAENIEGPWICLICGTPGKAMNFTNYYKFRRHLVEVHREKPVLNICEYCGQRSTKRNYLLHHMYTKHGVEPPATYNFPKCNLCNYVALTEALLQKHKSSHAENKNFRCNVCPISFKSSNQLLMHIQNTGHKYSADRKSNLQCIYCQKNFMREGNLFAHLKAHHRKDAIKDGIIDDSDDEIQEDKKPIVKAEPNINDYEELDIQYQIQQRPDGNITVVTKKSVDSTPAQQKILNTGLSIQAQNHKTRLAKTMVPQNEYVQEISMTSSNDTHDEIVMFENNEYIMRDNQLILRRPKQEEYILSDHGLQPVTQTTSVELTNLHNSNVKENTQHINVSLKNQGNISQSIPIYVSNEERLALMSSSQPIIYDSHDSNKTLTVLTAPHASTLENTTIDLDTTQSNDNMMIIQDEFPLNVSDSVVASENSNIVVVYSHQVGDQSKQYQLLTTQGLGTQFVQSSAILTQNFETVTTTTPIINAHVLEKQVGQVWQNNLQHIVDTDQIEITPIGNLQEQANQVPITDNDESNNDIGNLPQVEVPSIVAATTNNCITITPVSQCQEVIPEEVATTESLMETTVEETVDDAQNISPLDVYEGPIENPAEETVDSTIPVDTAVEIVTEPEEGVIPSDDVIEETEFVESPTYTQVEEDVQTPPENIDDIQQQSEELIVESQITENENVQISNKKFISEPNVIPDSITAAKQKLTQNTNQKVEPLASEWSEEDTQNRQEESLEETTPHDDSCVLDYDQEKNMETCEVEESIENIQQEVEKHMSAGTSSARDVVETTNVDNLSQDESEVEQEKVTAVTDPAIAQEKISSLLNDWEDNDSQDDNNSDTENVPTESNEIAKTVPNETTGEIKPVEKGTPDSQDKIRSLVSDWDEDDEENKD